MLRTVVSVSTSSRHQLYSTLPSFEQISGSPPLSTLPPRVPVVIERDTDRKVRQRERWLKLFDPTTAPHFEPNKITFDPYSTPPPPPYRHLPLITRERNHLLSLFLLELHAPTQQDPIRVWETLTAVLRYPTIRPTLLPSYHPTIDKSLAVDEIEGGERLLDTRTPIHLSLPELRKTFTVLSNARPPTRSGLAKLILVVELLAMRSAVELPVDVAGSTTDLSRGNKLEALRGGGVGLRPRDWTGLILFAGSCYRSPRPTHEIASITTLFAQWTKHQRSPTGRAFAPKLRVYNNLMRMAGAARSWTLYEAVEERMRQEEMGGQLSTMRIIMGVQETKGASIDVLWSLFAQGVDTWMHTVDTFPSLSVVEKGERIKDWQGLWNQMVWIYAKRGLLTEATKLYDAMRIGEGIDIRELAPIQEEIVGMVGAVIQPQETTEYHKIVPPAPAVEIYTALIQAFSLSGDLHSALSIMRAMSTPASPRSTSLPVFSAAPHPTPFFSSSTPHLTTETKRFEPDIHIYTCLFRGFATHGLPPSNSRYDSLNTSLLSGQRVGTNATSAQPYDLLRRFTDSRTPVATSAAAEDGNGGPIWTRDVLDKVLNAFLALTPPRRTARSVHAGARSAPSSKTLWWIIMAFDKLSGGDTQVVLEVWARLEAKFDQTSEDASRRKRSEKGNGWTGWLVDRRMTRTIEKLRNRRRVEVEVEAEWAAREQDEQ